MVESSIFVINSRCIMRSIDAIRVCLWYHGTKVIYIYGPNNQQLRHDVSQLQVQSMATQKMVKCTFCDVDGASLD
jgi:hypothetical protein